MTKKIDVPAICSALPSATSFRKNLEKLGTPRAGFGIRMPLKPVFVPDGVWDCDLRSDAPLDTSGVDVMFGMVVSLVEGRGHWGLGLGISRVGSFGVWESIFEPHTTSDKIK